MQKNGKQSGRQLLSPTWEGVLSARSPFSFDYFSGLLHFLCVLASGQTLDFTTPDKGLSFFKGDRNAELPWC